MNFEFDNNIPIYIQLVEQLKIYIISGNIDLGEKLPSVRDLSISFKVNPNTMQRALGELEELGLIYTKRTSGKFVTEDKYPLKTKKEQTAKYPPFKNPKWYNNTAKQKNTLIIFIYL